MKKLFFIVIFIFGLNTCLSYANEEQIAILNKAGFSNEAKEFKKAILDGTIEQYRAKMILKGLMDTQGNLTDKVIDAANVNTIQNAKQSNVTKTGKSTAEHIIEKEKISLPEKQKVGVIEKIFGLINDKLGY